jgi:hypothetical protein
MEHQDPIIPAICREIGNQKVLQAVLDKHTESGQPLMSILREEFFLDEEQQLAPETSRPAEKKADFKKQSQFQVCPGERSGEKRDAE